MTSREWVLIIAKEFNVSIRIAKMMYHSMIDTYLLKTNKSLYEPKGKVKQVFIDDVQGLKKKGEK